VTYDGVKRDAQSYQKAVLTGVKNGKSGPVFRQNEPSFN
jgi:hypothetical protein